MKRSKHRISQNALQADFSALNNSKVVSDQKGAQNSSGANLERNRPISEAEQTLVSGYSRQVQVMFSRYFYLLRTEKGLLWASGNPELAAFVRALWALNASAEFAEAA